MNRLCAAAVAVVFLSLFPAARSANAASVTGTVFSEEDRRIEHATVKLCDGGGATIAEEVTTDSGEFAFHGLMRGAYMLAVSAVGFQPQDLPVDLSFASERGVTVYLKTTSKAPKPTSPGATVSAHEMSMPHAARDLVDTGKRKFWANKDHEGGLADLSRAVAMAPDYYEAYYEIGLAYMGLGKQSDAEQNFRKSLDISGDKFGDAYVGLGSVLANRGNVADGEKALIRGVELNPKSLLGFYELSRVELSQKRIEDATKSAEQARALAPNFAAVHKLLANIHMQQKNYPELLKDIDAYVRLDPDSPAGVRAKQIREEVVRKMSGEAAGPVASRR